ncbi:hypothetical protein MPTK1_1g29590 [Marchantia polymorpha subsp. ruderalis]|uniref:Malectin-like domain-containing protein n=2 Tax=Marchantia polymorpha TaxID=3197 RepID=A0AAF6AVM1_MARPO|nr:hypothetical protein MARPO_0139s0015 [Marchantia polymorpha]BBN00492.1 hypothetical protein Mp_1g29590 [Marchantia polymorpha subsp. ruderalis]|eukprot:PTQ29538.1 hypothetical protein MARPO_0139s0015 [Marchantia polymorpha]
MTILWCLILFLVLQSEVSAQKDGFISIDCGSQDAYTDAKTGIQWVTDHGYIGTGFNLQLRRSASSSFSLETPSSDFGKHNLPRALRSARYFPTANSTRKNCYALPAQEGQVYLIRASFQLLEGGFRHSAGGDYQNISASVFDVSVDGNLWLTVSPVTSDDADPVSHEAIFIAQSHQIFFCLINTGLGDPFVSSLELRPLPELSYGRLAKGSFLSLLSRMDCGGDETQGPLRFPEDPFDRIWVRSSHNVSGGSVQSISTTQVLTASDLPTSVMGTAWSHETEIRFRMHVRKKRELDCQETTRFLSILHLRTMGRSEEVARHTEDLLLSFNEEGLLPDETTRMLESTRWDVRTMDSKSDFIESTWGISTSSSSSNPGVDRSGSGVVLNAAEFYALYPAASLTDKKDVIAVSNLQKSLNLSIAWTGDPCLPISWDWIVCDSHDPPRITSLLLNNTEFVGAIPDLSGFEKVEKIVVNEDTSVKVAKASSSRRFLQYLVRCPGSNGSGRLCPSIKAASTNSPDDASQQYTDERQAQWKRVLNSTAFIAVASVLAYLALIAITVGIVVQARRDLCPADVVEDANDIDVETGLHPPPPPPPPPPATSPPPTAPPPPPQADQISRETESLSFATSRTDLIGKKGTRSDE